MLAIADIFTLRLSLNSNFDSMRKSFYVMISRAIRQVVLLKEKGKTCDVDQLLPSDENILKRILSK